MPEYKISWKEVTFYEAYVEAPDEAHAYEVWNTGIEGQWQETIPGSPKVEVVNA